MSRSTRINSAIPHPARVWNFLNGGRDNFEADRAAARALLERAPAFVGVPVASRAFIERAVGFLAAEAGIRQFIDIGTGLPTADRPHELAQRSAPDTRTVYVDNDPMVISHNRSLARSAPDGAVASVLGDVRDPDQVLTQAKRTLDFGQPIAVLLLNMLAFVPDTDEVRSIIATFAAGVADGSYVVLAHVAGDIDRRLVDAANTWNLRAGWPRGVADHPAPVTLRSRAEVASLFEGLELVGPGVVPAADWRPDGRAPDSDEANAPAVPLYGVVARKPDTSADAKPKPQPAGESG
jgi:O-methyltransferase involved in polyketide biosynthesis